jgi:invasion protein IalB
MKSQYFSSKILSQLSRMSPGYMLGIASLVISSWCSQANAKQAAAEPEISTAVYGDWAVQCSNIQIDHAPVRVCELIQTIRVMTQASESDPGKAISLAQLAIGRVRTDEPYQVTVLLPFDVVLTNPVTIALETVDDLLPAMVWSRCVPAGCLASIALSEKKMKQLLQAKGSAKLRWQPASAAQPLQLPVSLKGLSSAFEYLSSQSLR